MSIPDTLQRLYRRWRVLQYKGLTRGGWASLSMDRRAEAIGILTAMAPFIPLMISDELGLDRGWPWHLWAVIAAAWGVACVGLMLRNAAHDVGVVSRRYRKARMRARAASVAGPGTD